MSDQRPEIEKWLPSEGMDSTTDFPHLGAARIDEPAYVLYSDHLRHLTLAKIEVLEDAASEVCPRCLSSREDDRHLFIYGEEEHHMNDDGIAIECDGAPIRRMIAALRKDLGE